MTPDPVVAVDVLTADDCQRLIRMFDRVSPASRYRRFFSPVPVLRPSVLRALSDVDHQDREALVARAGDEIVGIAHYFRDRDDPDTAEIAVLVEDGWQRRGVGQLLMRELGRVARRRGITTLAATTLPDNSGAVALARNVDPNVSRSWDGGMIGLVTHLPPARSGAAPLEAA